MGWCIGPGREWVVRTGDDRVTLTVGWTWGSWEKGRRGEGVLMGSGEMGFCLILGVVCFVNVVRVFAMLCF